MYGRNGQSICLLSPFFCPSSKIAQPKYAKGASERARSASVYGTEDLICVVLGFVKTLMGLKVYPKIESQITVEIGLETSLDRHSEVEVPKSWG